MKFIFVDTFQRLGLRFISQEAEHSGLKPRFSIMDAHDSFAVVQDLLHSTDRGRIFAAQQQISLWKNALLDPDRSEERRVGKECRARIEQRKCKNTKQIAEAEGRVKRKDA